MGDLLDIKTHPAFEYHGNPLELLEKKEPAPGMVSETEELQFGASFCSECEHRIDSRPWYKRWFTKAKVEDYLCRVSPRRSAINPVTGEKGFMPWNGILPSEATNLPPFLGCKDRNPTGNCRFFTLSTAKSGA